MNHALICHNGHLILGSIQRSPESIQPFCEKCGKPTTDRCQSCGWPIGGFGEHYWMAGTPYLPPNYCGECGAPFPWTEGALAAAKAYTDDLDQLSVEEKSLLKGTFPDLASDTARTPIAVNRFRKFVEKVGPAAGKGLLQIIVSVATEEAKRQLGLH